MPSELLKNYYKQKEENETNQELTAMVYDFFYRVVVARGAWVNAQVYVERI